ncbi:MAG: serine protease [Xanthomonadales bacterium]|nr:serine protease [Xanthomonadales bacterium]
MTAIKNPLLAIVVVIVFSLIPVNANAAEEPDLASILKQHSAALVTVKYVLTVNMGLGGSGRSAEQESETELTCSMISSEGLIVCSNNQLTGFSELLKQLSMKMTAVPKDIQVLVAGREQPYDAEIVIKDTELDIVWIRITNGGDTSFEHFNFTSKTEMNIGDPIAIIRRTGNTFGRTPVIMQSRIGGISSQPRKLYIPHTQTMNIIGTPAFSASGEVIGLMVTQLPEAGDSMGGSQGMFGSNMMNIQDSMSGLILPAADVLKATKRAVEDLKP